MLLLFERPELRARVTADPALIPNLIEEVLRLESPIQGFPAWPPRTQSSAASRSPRGRGSS